MRTRGYPVGTFDENADLIAVDHPEVTEHFRAARSVLLASRQDQATTEELRQALIHYRVLVAELLELDPSR